MKKTSITISFDEEKLSALKMYLTQRGVQVESELERSLKTLYTKTVPAGVREFIEMKSGNTPKPAPPVKKTNGNEYAEYQLGKLYLYGREIDRDYDKAMEYLQSAADKGNPYAKQLQHSVKSNRHWSAAMGSFRLLHHLARMLQNQLEDERKEKLGGIDRKLKRKIDEKKQAHGLKQ